MDRKSIDVILERVVEPEAAVVPKRLAPPRPRPRTIPPGAVEAEPATARRGPASKRGGKGPASKRGEAAKAAPLSGPSSIHKRVTLRPEAEMGLADLKKPRFEDHDEIARGGMAVVRRAFDHRLQRTVALKVLHDRLDPLGVAGLRFVEEAQITGQLEHPAIVPVHELLASDGKSKPTIVMKMVRGKTLRTIVDELGDQRLEPANVEKLVRALITVCDAIAFANEKGVVHCDLKPENVMLGRHGQVYVMDWGSGAVSGVKRAEDKGASATGTPEYMAPEQVGAFAGVLDARTDVYGIGGLIYYILTLRPPRAKGADFYEAMMAIHEGRIVPPENLPIAQALPPELSRIAMRCLAREPGERYETAAALKGELDEFLRGGGWLQTRFFKAGQLIIREGSVGGAAYVVVEGECEAFRANKGKRVTLGKINAGEAFGELAILSAKPRAASVVAVTDVVVKVITAESLERELARSSWVRIVIAALAERARAIADAPPAE